MIEYSKLIWELFIGELDTSLRHEKGRFRSLSTGNKLRYYGSLLGVTGLAALFAAGCGDSTSPTGDMDPYPGEDTPTLPQEDSSDSGGDSDIYDDEPNEDFPPDTDVTVTLYVGDGSADTYESSMTFEEMQELCEREVEEELHRYDASGLEGISATVTYPYTLAGDSSYQQFEYTCGN